MKKKKIGRPRKRLPTVLGRSCPKCGADAWYIPPPDPRRKRVYPRCSPCDRRRANAHHWMERETLSVAEKLWRSARGRAKKAGVDFTITPDDLVIGDRCPVLGIEYVIGGSRVVDGTPSIDRLDPSKGYTPENVRVISTRANRIKNNGTHAEHTLIAAWMRQELGE